MINFLLERLHKLLEQLFHYVMVISSTSISSNFSANFRSRLIHIMLFRYKIIHCYRDNRTNTRQESFRMYTTIDSLTGIPFQITHVSLIKTIICNIPSFNESFWRGNSNYVKIKFVCSIC